MLAEKSLVSLCDGRLLVLKEKGLETSTVPIYCACCFLPMTTMEDSISFRKVGVCSRCDGTWTNYPGIDWSLSEKWPRKDTPEWLEYMEIRVLYAKPILKLR